MAIGFAAQGHTVVGCARNAESLGSLQTELGSPHRFEAVDVANSNQVRQWAQGSAKELGPPDFLINCAALMNRNAPLWQLSEGEFSDLVDVNLKGVFHTIKHFVPAMQERGSGVIVNFSSYWGRSTSSDVAAYCATKWAIEGLSRGLADDLPNGMASVAFNPGVIHTEMLQSCFGDSAASYPKPEQWANDAVPFILGLGAADNGASVTVPGF
jgi:NAD(P)-dependent dehydrogenase (short-subunit alcohol dehydrogenase family)